MRLQLVFVFTPGCVECTAVRLLIKRIRPDYPELEVEKLAVTGQPTETAAALASAPLLVLDGAIAARKHVKQAELRRLLTRSMTTEWVQPMLPLGLPSPPPKQNGSSPDE